MNEKNNGVPVDPVPQGFKSQYRRRFEITVRREMKVMEEQKKERE